MADGLITITCIGMHTGKDLFGMDCFVVTKSVLLPFDVLHGVHP